jgi:hypothetical protein
MESGGKGGEIERAHWGMRISESVGSAGRRSHPKETFSY